MRLSPIWAGFAGHAGCTVPDQRFSLPGTNPSSEAVAHRKTRVIPAFGVALGAVLLGGVLAAPGWAQGSCVQSGDLVAIPCVESIERITPTSATITNQDTELKWRVKIRGTDGLRRNDGSTLKSEDNIDDANMVTATPTIPGLTFTLDNYNQAPIVIDGTATTFREYTYEITVPSAAIRRYSGTVTLTLGAFKDIGDRGVAASETTPRGANDNSFTIDNANRIDNLRAHPIANGLRVRWRAAPGAQAGYLVRWRQTGSGSLNTGDIVTGTSHDITGLTVGNEYIVRVDTRQAEQGPNGRATITGTNFSVTARVSAQLANIPSTGSVDADSDTPLRATLPEIRQNSYKIVSETATDSGYGSYQVTRDHSGSMIYAWNWVYRLNKDNEEVKALAPGQTLTDTFTIEDNSVPPSVATVTITITKSPPPTTICIKVGIDILGHDDGCVDEDLEILATEDSSVTQWRGRAVVTDPDAPERSFIPVQTRGTYGKFSLGADGLWVYALNNADPDTNALGIGQAGLDEFMIETVGGAATRKIRVGVWGANDPATFSGNLSGSVTEDIPFSYEACLRRNNPDPRTEGYMCLERGTINLGVITSGKVTVSDPDSNNASALKKRQGVQKGTYGSLFVNADQGYWRYVLDNDSNHVQGLTAGATVTETFTILAADDTPATVTITITGTRDISTIEGALTGSVTEGGVNTRASGTVRVTFNSATNQFRARSNIRGNYGTFNIDARGNWTYDLDGGDLLREGQVVYEPFRVESTLQNRTTAVVVIKVTGSDVVGAITASVGMGAGSRTSGRLTGHRGFEIGAHTRRGDFGCLIIQGNGTWEYLVYDTAPSSDCQASSGTQTATAGDSESFDLLFSRARYGDACSPDDSLDCISVPESVQFIERTLTININAGIAAVFDASTLTGAITEDTATTSGTVRATDADGDDNKFTAAGSSNPISGNYGSLTITEDGAWTYRLFNTLSAVQALGQGATLNDSLIIQAADGTTGTLVITITGVNDAATIGGTAHGSVTEDATNNRVSAFIRVTDVDGDNTLQAETVTKTYGDFVVNSSGSWTYTLFNGRAATNELRGGQRVVDQHRVRASDGTLGPVITITITGANDAATFGGTVHGSVTEDATETMATGEMTVTDVDGDNTLQARTSTGFFGNFVVNADGTWTYTLVNSRSATNALSEGQTTSEGLRVTASDGTSGPVIRITITGADDQATIGGDLAGSVTEDAVKADNSPDNQATGTVTLSDVDGGSSLTAQTDTAGKYGTFSLNATSGVWTYSLDNSDPDTNALRSGQTVNDETFTIAASDGASATVTLTITGADDPSIIGGTLAGAVTEDETVTTAGGTASITSTDSTVTFTAQTNASGRYGTFSLATTGVWTYSLDNSDADTNALAGGEEATDSFTIATSDSSTAAVVITVTGANDAASITGTLAGSVMEDGTPTASGSVTVTDVDGDNALKQQAADQTGSYGSLSVDHSAGSWTYTLNNSADAVQELTGGVRVEDTFTILAADDTPATVTITITGAIDPGDIAGATGSVTEDDTLKARARGRVMLDGVSDATFTAQTNVSGTYGTFNFEANGNWTYDLDNSRPATNALAGEAEVRDTLEIATADNSATAALIIMVTGNDDRSTIDAANLTGSVMEDGTLMASKTVTVTDVDTDPDPEIEERLEFPSAYGTFSITSAGVWTYTLDNNAAAVQALGAGQTLTEAFKIETEDGAEAVVTITITGTDDPREIEGTVTGSVTEDDEEASSSRGRVTVTGGADATFAVKANPPQSQTYGTFTIQPDGNWTYTLNNRDPDTNALKQGATATETITIEALEGTTSVDEKVVTITITGANDAAVFGAAGLTGAITEDAVPNTATGTATVRDVDGDNSFSTEVTPAQGIYGSLTLTSAGVWTYTLNNADPDTNALTAGQEVTDSFTIKASDGTETAVTITVTGAADRGEIEGDVSGSVREAAGDEDDQAQDRAGGRVRVAGDPAARFTVQTDTATTYGTFSLTAEGVWTYRLDNDKGVTDALRQGRTVTETITIEATSDNTPRTATVTITVMGSEVGGDLTGSIREGSRTPVGGKLTTEQDYEIMDVEDIRRGEFGCLKVRSDGSWTYWLYGTNDLCPSPSPIEPLAQSGTVTVLAAEQARMDVFTIEVRRPDGTVIRVSLTITIEEAAAPVTRTVAVTGYLQGRAGVLLGKQPGLGGFLKDLRSGITSEGQVSLDVRDGALLGFDGSFVRDGFWGALSVARSEQGSGKTDQIFGTLGYHGQVADAALVGLMLQFDQADGRLDAGLGSIDGQGWLFGPYFATRYQAQPQVSPLTLEGRLLYGPTSNDVRFVDGGTGTFDTQRWLASFRLEGEVLLDYGDRAIRLIPHFDAGWVQDKVEAFTDSEGMQVAGQTIRFSEVALGSDIEVPVRFGQRDAMITGGLSLVSAREQSQSQNARVSVSDTHSRLELGLDYRLANGIELEFGGSYDDVEGTDSEGKFSLSFGLSNQF